jgi:hypothetical protein
VVITAVAVASASWRRRPLGGFRWASRRRDIRTVANAIDPAVEDTLDREYRTAFEDRFPPAFDACGADRSPCSPLLPRWRRVVVRRHLG